MTADPNVEPLMDLDSVEFVNGVDVYDRLAASPGGVLTAMLGGVEVTVVTDYAAALEILGDPERFPADVPRGPVDSAGGVCPAAAGLRSWSGDGDGFARFQRMFGRVDLGAVVASTTALVEEVAEALATSDSGDLLREFAIPVVRAVLRDLLGLGAHEQRVFEAAMALRRARDPVSAAGRVIAVMGEAFADRHHDDEDAARRWWLYEDGATADQVARWAATLYVSGAEPTWNLIALTLMAILTDEKLGGAVHSGGLTVRDAIEHTLFTSPPLSHAVLTYPRQPQPLKGRIVADLHLRPVVISIAACHRDPAVTGAADLTGNRAHLAWGARARLCPAPRLARTITETAVAQLLDLLPETPVPTGAPIYLPGGVHRALAGLPVRLRADTTTSRI
ncbi:hypothetical protein ACTD5D_09705 [Nocardia takedensis]|uniref:hypothetical protein n=1 Tax=Nocardia takedensis TaxID=259390 RepID=UPI003F7702C9